MTLSPFKETVLKYGFRCRTITAFALAVMLTCPRLVFADDSPVSIQFSLAKSRVSLGSPIVLKWSIVNTTDQPICVKWNSINGGYGPYDDQTRPPAWLVVDVAGPFGRSAPLRPDLRSVPLWDRKKDLHFITIRPGQSIDEAIALTLWFQPSTVGAYRVVVQPKLTHKLGVYPGIGDEAVYTKEETLPLTVTMFSRANLLQIARTLKAEAIAGKGDPSSRLAIRQLVSMPEEVVAPIWLDLGVDKLHNREDFMTLLTGFLKTPTSKAIAAEIRKRKPGYY